MAALPRAPPVSPDVGGAAVTPRASIPAVIGPVQWVGERGAPVSGSEHVSFDGFRRGEVRAWPGLAVNLARS